MNIALEGWQEGALAPKNAAEILGRTPRTLGRMADRGQLRVFRMLGGHRRYSLMDVMALLERERGRIRES